MSLVAAIKHIEREGALLVFPITNRAEPASLWSALHPRVPMRWQWDEDADDRVVELWRLRERLAHSRKVVYSKWYRGRAVFFSRALFTAMLADLFAIRSPTVGLSQESRELLEVLEGDSPISTKVLRARSGLQGKMLESAYTRGMRTLWSRLLAVGTGEVDDGAFPSLAIGATRWIFEDLWEEAQRRIDDGQRALIEKKMPPKSPFGKLHRQVRAELEQAG